jgi:hypothetical protein
MRETFPGEGADARRDTHVVVSDDPYNEPWLAIGRACSGLPSSW